MPPTVGALGDNVREKIEPQSSLNLKRYGYMSENCIILMYHIIDEFMNSIEQRFCCTPGQFRLQMCYLKDEGYTVIIVRCLNGEVKWPEKAIAITFDDGTSCTYDTVFPMASGNPWARFSMEVSYEISVNN
ncbi:MAG: hypothetical protein GXP14_08045 [Gammaproteobacteria bacterium]|nr:hypothetical protein [Gammaproteobacteria bacterium]